MIIEPNTKSLLITDSKCGEENAPEQPVLIDKYSDGLSITAWDGQSIHIAFTMVPDLIKALKQLKD